MTPKNIFECLIYLGALVLLTPILGSFMAKVFERKKSGTFENLIYKIIGTNSKEEMDWRTYSWAVVWFHVLGIISLVLIQMIQKSLPLNPESLPNVPWHLALNTAVSFVTNTNWQAYSGENTLSYFTQAVGLAVHNFLSAATGIAVLVALIRGLTRKTTTQIGNFWVDLTRSTLYILLPLSILMTLILVSQGVVQNFSPYIHSTTLEGVSQIIPMGPAASQIAIKQLGTNGGGFFGVNSAHPFENPTPFSNFLEVFAILILPAALVYSFGVMTKNIKHARIIFTVMLLIFVSCLAISLWSEYTPNPVNGLTASLEGKEVCLGVTNSILWSTATTAASNGSVNAMHDSLTPIAGAMALFQMMLGEIVFGGIGSGLYGMLLFVLMTVFLAGLMVGRTPEYLGKKIERREIQMVILAILAPSAAVLIGAGISSVLPIALSSLSNKGPHGLSQILYAYTSAANNNGSAFGGLNVNTIYYNLTLSIAMLIGRFAVIFPVLAIAGSLAEKKYSPPSAGTFSTETPIFGVLLFGVIIIVGALTFLPSLSLGPIAEHFLMLQGRTF